MTHSVWLAERIALAHALDEDIFFLGCTPRYPIKKLRDTLQSSHKVVWVRDGPELHGWPHKRMRWLVAALNIKTMAWVGPSSDAAITNGHSAKFHRSTAVPGDVFMMAPDAEVRAGCCRLARARGYYIDDDKIDDVPTEDLFADGLASGCGSELQSLRV